MIDKTRQTMAARVALYHRNVAHRGLHDNKGGIPENSCAAFRAAAAAGYGVELDVQLSKDGRVVVFHDDTLTRVCGVDNRVDAYDYCELARLPLLGTDERIPLFEDVLAILAGGSGPLICELKPGPRNEELCRKTYELLKTYRGIYAIESFHPMIVDWFRRHAPAVCRGQLALPADGYHDQPLPLRLALGHCLFSYLNKPDFIAYKNVERPRRVMKLREKGVMLIAWTSVEPDVDQRLNDAVIFEGYRPPLTY